MPYPLAAVRPKVLNIPIVTYLLRDEFTTDDASPVASPRTAEPGPGTLTITDPGNILSISSGNIHYDNVNPSVGNLGIQDVSRVRVAGRMLLCKMSCPTAVPMFPLWSAWWLNNNLAYGAGANVAHYFYTESGTWWAGENQAAATNLGYPFSLSTNYELAIVLRSIGAFHFIRGGVFTDWTLVWIGLINNATPLYATLAPASSGVNSYAYYDYMRVRDLPAPFTLDQGIAIVNATTPVSGVSYTATADAIHDFTFSLPGSPAAGNKMELRYRVLDDNNYWTAYVERNVGNTAWDFKLDSVAAGSPANRITVTGVGSPDLIRVTASGSLHDCFTKSGTTWSKRGTQVNVSHQNTQTTIKAVFTVGTSTALRSYARTSSIYTAELNRV